MPNCTFKIEGTVVDFSRVDDTFKAMRLQTLKMLKDWTISISVDYEEKQGTGELPK
jgi:hypothetical protein